MLHILFVIIRSMLCWSWTGLNKHIANPASKPVTSLIASVAMLSRHLRSFTSCIMINDDFLNMLRDINSVGFLLPRCDRAMGHAIYQETYHLDATVQATSTPLFMRHRDLSHSCRLPSYQKPCSLFLAHCFPVMKEPNRVCSSSSASHTRPSPAPPMPTMLTTNISETTM